MTLLPTNAENQVTSNIAFARSQRNTENAVFWLAQNDVLRYICRYVINVSTELEMTSDDRQNGGKANYVTHCKCA